MVLAMVLEIAVEKHLVKSVEARGGVCAKTVRPGRRGWPDRTVILKGKVFFVELKRPKNGRLSQQQRDCHAEIHAAGGFVYVLTDRMAIDMFFITMDRAVLINAS